MARPKALPDAVLEDPHFVRGFIEKRLLQLSADGPVGDGLQPSRPQRDAILAFVKARKIEVGDLRVRTYVAWLPLAAVRLGVEFLEPSRDVPAQFAEAFPPKQYARGSRETVAQCLATFWRWKFASEGEEYPSWLRLKLEKWKPTNGASDMLTRDDVALIAENALNFRDRA